MQWSKLRASVRALICPELRQRIDFHVTQYRVGTSSKSGLVTIDGKRVLALSYFRFCRHGDGWFASGESETKWSPKQCDEIHPPRQLGDAMRGVSRYAYQGCSKVFKSLHPIARYHRPSRW